MFLEEYLENIERIKVCLRTQEAIFCKSKTSAIFNHVLSSMLLPKVNHMPKGRKLGIKISRGILVTCKPL